MEKLEKFKIKNSDKAYEEKKMNDPVPDPE